MRTTVTSTNTLNLNAQSNNSIQEITDDDLNHDLPGTPPYYAPVIDEKDIREELETKDKYENTMENHKEIGESMEEEEIKLLQEGYLAYYDQISIILK